MEILLYVRDQYWKTIGIESSFHQIVLEAFPIDMLRFKFENCCLPVEPPKKAVFIRMIHRNYVCDDPQVAIWGKNALVYVP